MAEFPIAPTQLPAEMHDLLHRVAHLWANHPDRPRPKLEILDHWDRLIPAWSVDPSLPLFVRKTAKNRGHVLRHPSGWSIVPSDNSPAHWAFAAAVLGQAPTIDDIRNLLAKDQIPVAMVFGKEERQNADYRCSLRDGTKLSC
jgi:hypothetical protein